MLVTANPMPAFPYVLDIPFSMKIGDGDNVFDGLCSVFPEIRDGKPDSAAFNLSTFCSYHAKD